MEQLKCFWRQYQKEIIVIVSLMVILLTIGGTYYYLQYHQKDKSVGDAIILKEESLEDEKTSDMIEEDDVQTPVIENIQVDIKGEVQNPGVYVTTPSSRVIDIINSAGGLTKNADTSYVNLSKKLHDEMVIIIYSKDEVNKITEVKEKEKEIINNLESEQQIIKNDAVLKEEDILGSQDSLDNSIKNEDGITKVSINKASKEELMTLSGIGESKANAIITYRNEHGSFEKIEDIMKVSGIGESLFEKIKNFITI